MSHTAMKIALTFAAIDAASGTVRALDKGLLGMGSAAKRAQKDFDSMATNMASGLKGLTATFLAFEKLKPAITIAADMQEAMTELESSTARVGQNAAKFHEELEKVRDVAGKLQVMFPFGQKEMIEAATVLAQSGMKLQEISSPTGALYSVGALASIGKVDTRYAAQLMSTAANVFGLKEKELSKFADWSQKIGTTTTLHVKDQALALSEGGAAAGILKMSYKDTLTAMATISQMEGGPSKAGERLAEFAQRIMGATKQEKKALKEAGLSFYDKKGNLLPFPEIVKSLQDLQTSSKFANKTQEQQLQLWKEIFQGRGEYGAFALAKTGKNSFQAIQSEAERSLAIKEKVDLALEDLNTKFRALTGTVQTAIADGFAPVLPALGKLVDSLNDAATAADLFAKAHPKEMKVAEEVGAAGIGIGALWSIYKVFKGMRSGFRALKALSGFGGMGVDMIGGTATAAITRAMPVYVTNWEMMLGGRGGVGMPKIPGKALQIAETAAVPVAMEVATLSAGAAAASGGAVVTGLAASSWFMKESVMQKYKETGYLPPSPMDRLENKRFMDTKWQDPDEALIAAGTKNRRVRSDWEPQFMEIDADKIANAVKSVKPELHSTVNLTVNVDQNGRVTSSTNDPKATINLKRGKFMESLSYTTHPFGD
jgi:TP901 family phage tail tape measure protein